MTRERQRRRFGMIVEKRMRIWIFASWGTVLGAAPDQAPYRERHFLNDEVMQQLVRRFHIELECIVEQNRLELQVLHYGAKEAHQDHCTNGLFAELRRNVCRYANCAEASQAALFARGSSAFMGIDTGGVTLRITGVSHTVVEICSSHDRHNPLHKAAHHAGWNSRNLIKKMRQEGVPSLTPRSLQAVIDAWERFCNDAFACLSGCAERYLDMKQHPGEDWREVAEFCPLNVQPGLAALPSGQTRISAATSLATAPGHRHRRNPRTKQNFVETVRTPRTVASEAAHLRGGRSPQVLCDTDIVDVKGR